LPCSQISISRRDWLAEVNELLRILLVLSTLQRYQAIEPADDNLGMDTRFAISQITPLTASKK